MWEHSRMRKIDQKALWNRKKPLSVITFYTLTMKSNRMIRRTIQWPRKRAFGMPYYFENVLYSVKRLSANSETTVIYSKQIACQHSCHKTLGQWRGVVEIRLKWTPLVPRTFQLLRSSESEPTRIGRLPASWCWWSIVTIGLSRSRIVSEMNVDFGWKSQNFPPSVY